MNFGLFGAQNIILKVTVVIRMNGAPQTAGQEYHKHFDRDHDQRRDDDPLMLAIDPVGQRLKAALQDDRI